MDTRVAVLESPERKPTSAKVKGTVKAPREPEVEAIPPPAVTRSSSKASKTVQEDNGEESQPRSQSRLQSSRASATAIPDATEPGEAGMILSSLSFRFPCDSQTRFI